MEKFNFAILPPFKAAEMVADLQGDILGIEVTMPVIESRCNLGNIDHHRQGDTSATPSACEQAMQWPIPADNTTLVGVLADADTITAMAVLECRATGQDFDQNIVNAIGLIDRFGPASCKAEMDLLPVKAIRAICADRNTNLHDQVYFVCDVLGGYIDPRVKDMIKTQEKQIQYVKANAKISKVGDFAIVESSDFAALQLGYEIADVVIAINPVMQKDFQKPEAGTYRKITIAKRDEFTPFVINWGKLNQFENKAELWGGRSTIGGSPQGIDTDLTIDQVISCIEPV